MGFKIIDVGINEKYPQFDTYIFENTEELNKTIYELTKKGEDKNGKICKNCEICHFLFCKNLLFC